MNFICVLMFIFLSSNLVDGGVDQLILNWFPRECVCNWSMSFLLGVHPNTVLYVNKDSFFEIDIKESVLIESKHKLQSDYFSEYFTGCLIKLKKGFFYVVIYRDQILNLTNEYFGNASIFR